jgi:hypothetical protein
VPLPAPASASPWQRLAPFVAAAAPAYLVLPLTTSVGATSYSISVVLGLLVVAMAVAARTPPVVPALTFLLSAALLRHAGGGNASGVGVLALLPVFWLALHGTRRQLMPVLAGVGLYFLGPILLVGGTAYPTSGFRTAALFVLVASVLGTLVQRLVAQTRRHPAELDRHRDDLERVASSTRAIAAAPHARGDLRRRVRAQPRDVRGPARARQRVGPTDLHRDGRARRRAVRHRRPGPAVCGRGGVRHRALDLHRRPREPPGRQP